MDDLTMTKLCAEAMGISVVEDGPQSEPPIAWLYRDPTGWNAYDPLTFDAQAMALVKKLELDVVKTRDGWLCRKPTMWKIDAYNADLNRAIVECVAKLQAPSDKG